MIVEFTYLDIFLFLIILDLFKKSFVFLLESMKIMNVSLTFLSEG